MFFFLSRLKTKNHARTCDRDVYRDLCTARKKLCAISRIAAALGAGEARKEREGFYFGAATVTLLRISQNVRANKQTDGRTDGRGRAFAQRDILRAEIVTPTDMRPRTRSKANIRNDTPSVDSRRLAATREERERARESRRKRVEKEKEEKERRVRKGGRRNSMAERRVRESESPSSARKSVRAT